MVSAVEHLCVGYYDEISKKKARAHVNETNVLNYMCPTVTKKLRHVFGDESPVNPYQKPQRLINCLIELFSNPDAYVENVKFEPSNLIILT